MKPDKTQNLPEPYGSLFGVVLADCGAEAIKVFVQQGADLHYLDPNTGATLLYTATKGNHVRSVIALVQNGADPNQKVSYRSSLDWRADTDRVALHYAWPPETAKVLIKAGADVNAIDAAGTTPLMSAAERGSVTVVKLLLTAGASPLARQIKRPRKQAMTAREFAEAKLEFWQDTGSDAADRRAACYREIRDILLEAEKASSTPNSGSQ